MKRKDLMTALMAAAGITIAGSANSAVHPDEVAAFEAAVDKGSQTAYQEFLLEFPNSSLADKALDEMIKLASDKSRGRERSGNERAVGGSEHRGQHRGESHPAC